MLLRELFVKLGLNIDAQSFAKGQLAAEAVKFGLGKLADAAKNAVHGFIDLVKEVAHSGEEIKDQAQMVGVSTKSLQEWRKAASNVGLEAETMDFGLMRISRALANAAGGAKGAAEAFTKAGVKFKGVNGKARDVDEAMMDLAAHFEKMPNGPEKTALAMELFGRSGARMIPLLNQGREEIAKYRKEAVVMSEEQLEAAGVLNRTFDKLGRLTHSVLKQAIYPLIPAITSLVKSFYEWQKANAKMLSQRLSQVFGVLLTIIKALAAVFKGMVSVLRWLTEQWRILAALLGGVMLVVIGQNYAAIGKLILQYGRMGLAALAAGGKAAAAWVIAMGPLAMVVAGIAEVILIIEDLTAAAKGQESFFGKWMETYRRFFKDLWEDERFAKYRGWIENAAATWQKVRDWIVKAFDDGTKQMQVFFAEVEKRARPAIDALGKVASFLGYERPTETMEAAKERRGFGSRGHGLVERPEREGGLLGAIKSAGRGAEGYFAGVSRGYEDTIGPVQYSQISKQGTVKVSAPNMNVSLTVHAAPGQTAEDVARQTSKMMQEWYATKMEEARASQE